MPFGLLQRTTLPVVQHVQFEVAWRRSHRVSGWLTCL